MARISLLTERDHEFLPRTSSARQRHPPRLRPSRCRLLSGLRTDIHGDLGSEQRRYTAGYLLSYGTQSGSYSTTVDVGNVVSYPVSLAPGNTYYVVVRAYNSQRQNGPASPEASVAIPALPTPPTATITATLGASGTASVTWRTTNATTVTVNGAGGGAQCHCELPDRADHDVHGGGDGCRRHGHGLGDRRAYRGSIAR